MSGMLCEWSAVRRLKLALPACLRSALTSELRPAPPISCAPLSVLDQCHRAISAGTCRGEAQCSVL